MDETSSSQPSNPTPAQMFHPTTLPIRSQPTRAPAPMSQATTLPVRSKPTSETLPPLSPHTLPQRFPVLPAWAFHAFHEICSSVQTKQERLTPEARALLNIAILPMLGYKYGDNKEPMLDCSVSIRELFHNEKSFKYGREHVVLVRLSSEVVRLWICRHDLI